MRGFAALIFVSTIGLLSMPLKAENNVFNHLGVGLEVGTTGIGLEVSTTMNDYFQLRAGASFVPNIDVYDFTVSIAGSEKWTELQTKFKELSAQKEHFTEEQQAIITKVENLSFMKNAVNKEVGVESNLKLGASVKLLVDYLPFKNSSFRFTAGFYYSNSNKIVEATSVGGDYVLEAITYYNEYLANKTFSATIKGKKVSYEFGDPLTVTVGGDGKNGVNQISPNGPKVTAYVEVNGFRPYLGIGFGRAVPTKHRLGFACDLGVMFWNAPTINVNDYNLQTEGISDDNGGDIIKIVPKIVLYPCLNFRLTGRIF